ncbi:uncharacterized protein LOC143846915 [Tasmannia lanceolata]|uniref:uncharacterized protein LOC143846915 n=1 Tax=Tasmannia lanceolata TaxID=3420 RepID=UPI004062A7F9
MASSSLGGAVTIKLPNFCLDLTKTKYGRLETLCGTKPSWIRPKPVIFSGLVQSRRSKGQMSISCGPSWIRLKPEIFAGLVQSRRSVGEMSISCGPSSDAVSDLEDGSEQQESIGTTSHIFPNSLEVQSLLTEICDTTYIAEFELKLGGFRLYVTRDVDAKNKPPVPPSALPIDTNTATGTPYSNGSVATASLEILKPKPSIGGIQRLLDTATDEGLVILQSPKVGYFRRSRTIKGKRAPPSCKEKQIVKEGQVLCYIEQLGGEIPIESDVSGEVIKLLRKDGEPVGYGDALIAILPSFPGIKKLQ